MRLNHLMNAYRRNQTPKEGLGQVLPSLGQVLRAFQGQKAMQEMNTVVPECSGKDLQIGDGESARSKHAKKLYI